MGRTRDSARSGQHQPALQLRVLAYHRFARLRGRARSSRPEIRKDDDRSPQLGQDRSGPRSHPRSSALPGDARSSRSAPGAVLIPRAANGPQGSSPPTACDRLGLFRRLETARGARPLCLLADVVLRDARAILFIAWAVHDVFGIRFFGERRVAARSFWILRLEETDVFPRPPVLARVGHPNREVLACAGDAKAYPGLPALVVPHDEFGAHRRLACRHLFGGKIVGLPEPEVAKWFAVGCRIGAGELADRVLTVPAPQQILDGCELLLHNRRHPRPRRRGEERGGGDCSKQLQVSFHGSSIENNPRARGNAL